MFRLTVTIDGKSEADVRDALAEVDGIIEKERVAIPLYRVGDIGPCKDAMIDLENLTDS